MPIGTTKKWLFCIYPDAAHKIFYVHTFNLKNIKVRYTIRIRKNSVFGTKKDNLVILKKNNKIQKA